MISEQIERVRKLQLIELINKRINRMQLVQDHLKELVSRQAEDNARFCHVQKQILGMDEKLERGMKAFRRNREGYRAYIDDIVLHHDPSAMADALSSSSSGSSTSSVSSVHSEDPEPFYSWQRQYSDNIETNPVTDPSAQHRLDLFSVQELRVFSSTLKEQLILCYQQIETFRERSRRDNALCAELVSTAALDLTEVLSSLRMQRESQHLRDNNQRQARRAREVVDMWHHLAACLISDYRRLCLVEEKEELDDAKWEAILFGHSCR